jgi:ABC-2 type transport system permease protein
MFSSYPLGIFDGWTRVLVFTLLPAAFVGAIPAGLVRSFDQAALAELAAAAAISLGVGAAVFHRGLKRYQSGNAIQARI